MPKASRQRTKTKQARLAKSRDRGIGKSKTMINARKKLSGMERKRKQETG